jgi:hypothetical protein
MNGGTSLRAEGTINPLAASSIDSTIRYRASTRPAVAAFGGFRRRRAIAGDCAVSTCRARRNGADSTQMRAANRRVIDIVTTRQTVGRQGLRAWNFGFA